MGEGGGGIHRRDEIPPPGQEFTAPDEIPPPPDEIPPTRTRTHHPRESTRGTRIYFDVLSEIPALGESWAPA